MGNVPAIFGRKLAAVVTKQEAVLLASELWGGNAALMGGSSATARKQAQACAMLSLSLSKWASGDSSRLQRLAAYAGTLPEFKVSKSGVISGNIGKFLRALNEAVQVGANAPKGDKLELASLLITSPFLALVAQEKKAGDVAPVSLVAKGNDEQKKVMVKPLTLAEIAAAAATMGGALDNAAAAAEGMRIDAAAAAELAAAAAAAAHAAWLAEMAENKVKDLIRDKALAVFEFQALAVALGIKLSPSQLKALKLAA